MQSFRQDIQRYRLHRSSSSLFVILCTEQGLWALAQYRLASSIYQATLPPLLKQILLGIMVILQKIIEILTGICLPYAATIGPGFYIGHFGNIFINHQAVIGSRCNISQGVTIGISGRGSRRGVPKIGNNVYIGTNAVIIGKITVGDDAVIAANSLVNANVPPHVTMLGVPARIHSQHGSEYYLDPPLEDELYSLAEMTDPLADVYSSEINSALSAHTIVVE